MIKLWKWSTTYSECFIAFTDSPAVNRCKRRKWNRAAAWGAVQKNLWQYTRWPVTSLCQFQCDTAEVYSSTKCHIVYWQIWPLLYCYHQRIFCFLQFLFNTAVSSKYNKDNLWNYYYKPVINSDLGTKCDTLYRYALWTRNIICKRTYFQTMAFSLAL